MTAEEEKKRMSDTETPKQTEAAESIPAIDEDAEDAAEAQAISETLAEADAAIEAEDSVGKPSTEEILRAEIESLKHEVLLAKADTENTRKRIEKSKHEAIRYASLPLMRELLTVTDNLELALKYAPQDDPLRNGVQMALEGMKKTLLEHHMKPVPGVGSKFDPALHEALSIGSDPSKGDGEILEELRTGYTLYDRIVRPAGVVVNRKPQEEPATE